MRINRMALWGLLTASLVCSLLLSSAGAQSTNPIPAENDRPGTSAGRWTNGSGSTHQIEGYASANSINRGSHIQLFVSTKDPSYTLAVYRIGYYQGLGGRLVFGPVTLPGHLQPMPTPDPQTGLIQSRWSYPYTLTAWNPADPTDWVSGIYLVKLTGSVSGKQSYIIFVVRDDSRTSDILFKRSVNTYEAYNAWSSKSLYCFNSNNVPVAVVTAGTCSNRSGTLGIQAVKVSFDRPYDEGQGSGFLFDWEIQLVFFLESQGYDLSYCTDRDIDYGAVSLFSSSGAPLHRAFLSTGHDEYWSALMRGNVAKARDLGLGLGFFGADTMYWQIRCEPSTVTGVQFRTLVGYKENWLKDPDAQNSSTYGLITSCWRCPRFTFPARPEDALVGVMYSGDDPVNSDIVVTNPSYWVFAHTGLSYGAHLSGLLGYEVDKEFGDQPRDTVVLADSPYVFKGATHYSDMTIYKAGSGAWVFATGSMQWNCGR